MTNINIDGKFVELAKNYNLNLERIANDAIKKSLYPHLSTGERICLDFDLYLQELKREQKCFFLDYKIEGLTLVNIGKFDEFNVKKFKEYNVLTGPCGVGKSIIFNAMACAGSSGNIAEKSLLKCGQDEGEIILVESSDSKMHLKITEKETKCFGEYENPQSVILDDAGCQLTADKYRDFLCYLRDLDIQVIMTARSVDDVSAFTKIFPDCNFVDLRQ